VQTWAGTDRQCRGRLLAVLRESEGAVPLSRLDAAWSEETQRVRSLAGLVEDGLVVRTDAGSYALP
jgi:A/G-specific adenine glycosylase